MKFLITLLIFSFSMSAQANGILDVWFPNFQQGYNIGIKDGKVAGYNSNMAGARGPITLEKVDGLYEGKFGIPKNIQVTEVKTDGEKTQITLRTLPGGYYTYNISKNDRGSYRINGTFNNGLLLQGSLKADGSSMSFSSSNVQFNYRLIREGKYDGSARIITSGRILTDLGVRMDFEGDMAPLRLIEVDPSLFIIAYALPGHLYLQ